MTKKINIEQSKKIYLKKKDILDKASYAHPDKTSSSQSSLLRGKSFKN